MGRHPNVRGIRTSASRSYTSAAIMAAAGVVYAVLASEVWAPATSQVVSNHLMTILPALAALWSFVVAKRDREQRLGWLLLGAWGTLSAAGNALWTYYELVAHVEPFPSLADVGYLGGNLCAVAAVVSFTVTIPRASRWRTIVDAALIGGSVFLVSWSLVLQSVYEATEGPFLSQAVGLAYPVIDVVVISLTVFVATRVVNKLRAPIVLIGVGMVGWAVADTSFAYLTAKGTYVSGSPVDTGWIVGDAIIAVAAFHAMWREPGEPQAAHNARLRPFLPYVVAGLAMLAGFVHQVLERHIDATTLGLQMGVLVLVVLRQFFLVLEHKSVTIDRMRSVDDMKNQILRAVSHELRTPLTVIKGIAEVLELDDDNFSDLQKDLLGRLSRNAERLEDYLVSLLDLERLTRGVIEPSRQPTEILQLSTRIAGVLYQDSHPLRVEPGVVWANVDPAHVERIVENLMINATRHTPAGTTVRTSATRVDEGVLITVADDGPGVPDDKKSAIFEPFKQIEDSIGNARGSGVGLALVAKFAELHGGRAWVEDNPGGGARFRVLLADGGAHEPQRERVGSAV